MRTKICIERGMNNNKEALIRVDEKDVFDRTTIALSREREDILNFCEGFSFPKD